MATLEDRQVRAIEDLVADWVFREPIPGASIVVVDADGELYAEGFGARDLETNAAATPDTLFGMGSISKSVTALAVLGLVEDGALSLDDAVDEYVDALVDLPGDPVTVEELLTHTSGMPGFNLGVVWGSVEGLPGGVADRTDRRRLFRAQGDRRITDDESFRYNNAGYGVLGSVVEAVDGRSYEQYVREDVLDPLGMDRSGFGNDALAADEDAMTPYRPDGDAVREAPLAYDEFAYPPGGLVSSVREMGRYLRAVMTDGAADGHRVCAPDTVERLYRGRVTLDDTRLDGAEAEYGYGWFRDPFDDDVLVGHSGTFVGTSAYAGFLEAGDVGVVLACNANADPQRIAMAALAAATDRDRTVVPAYALDAKAEAVIGTYTDYRERTTVTVEREGGGLAMTVEKDLFEGEQVIRLFPESLDPDDHRFYTVSESGWRNPVTFDVDGECAELFYDRERLRRTDP